MSYRGTRYHGWQVQKNALGIQQVINESLSLQLRGEVKTIGSGRTDKGVHAEQQYFHLDSVQEIDVVDMKYKLNKSLPDDICINSIHEVPLESHARYSASGRKYEYRISREKQPFGPDLAYWFRPELEYSRMNQAALMLIGEKSFESFSRVKTEKNHFICDVTEAKWEWNETTATFVIVANRFLRGMVRTIVGTLLDIGQNRRQVPDMKRIIQSCDRKQAGRAVPPHGLYLCRVFYPKSILNSAANG